MSENGLNDAVGGAHVHRDLGRLVLVADGGGLNARSDDGIVDPQSGKGRANSGGENRHAARSGAIGCLRIQTVKN